MNRKAEIVKLKKLSFWFSLVVMLALGANAIFLVMIQRSYNSVVVAQTHRQDAISLADMLKEDAEQLPASCVPTPAPGKRVT